MRLRRHEQINLHAAMQGLRTSGMLWLCDDPPADVTAATTTAAGSAAAGTAVGSTAARTGTNRVACTAACTAAGVAAGSAASTARAFHGPSQHAAAQRRLAAWTRWLLQGLVVPLLRAHFYATETEAYRQEVFYYRCGLLHLCSKN